MSRSLKFEEEKRKFIRDVLFRKAASPQVKLAALERICASTGGELNEQGSQTITKISVNSEL
jgi:hypothetical protein